ncbi:selenium metabolism membrane protein YedE/FdhT [Wohlfahrtiimonas chitiniclastica]|uniref:selenium metabolism membrane protein YedE/FdhT n=1 Tax=Wohlfahrtiimonas chitiniclastica TaxID=400946 RepID=UPI001BCB072B|nr:selenium metabolism membrane protein YedE/FdhT [Wohlfahrtiimonas chitiniclastica]MBS7836690.1 selenium metabolism membrane protein YedE/FdhT [Wohlfahrtiimonas chitiniclastica]
MTTWHTFKQKYLIQFWNPVAAVIAAGILATYYFGITGTLWAVTGEFTRWGGHILQAFGVDPSDWTYFKMIGFQGSPLDRTDGLLLIGMFGGCIAAALWANNIKYRSSPHKIRIFQALVGGIIAGFGARLAMGCNLAAFFTGIPQFSLHAWFFAITTAIGSYAGAKVALHPIFRIPLKVQKVTAQAPLKQNPAQVKRRFIIGSIVFAALFITGIVLLFIKPLFGIALIFGTAFGLLIERAQICFTSAFRDLWITGRTHMAKAIIIGMIVSTIGTFAFIEAGIAPKIYWAAPNAILGGLLFGFGIVLAGGCETGWMYRAVEGQVHYWWVGAGNIIGATVLAYYWDDLSPYLVADFDKIDLLKSIGTYGGLIFNYALMMISLGLILWWERRFFNRRAKAAQAAITRPINVVNS